ncbi:MAG: hypothetical protein ABIP89_03635 [Polyangiaceae bacterium]
MGFSLAACAGVVFAGILGSSFSHDSVYPPGGAWSTPGVATGISTLGFGLVWARVVRIRAGKFPLGWLAAVPLAALNAGTALGLIMMSTESGGGGAGFLGGLVLGATFGAMFWIPALITTLICFGVPLHFAQRAADKGLGSEDRGERTVGVAAACFALLALLLVSGLNRPSVEGLVLASMAVIGLATGAASATYATLREQKRRLFLGAVGRGAEDGYRVTHDAGQSLLVRVTRTPEVYRGADLEEPLVELDDSGDVKRTLEFQQ